ncbi:MAG: hypothetical protein JST54_14990 [Deltaproteobacteria bacterium]|nr:hypothetical protein [Deltaproteobacteria bacterium]
MKTLLIAASLFAATSAFAADGSFTKVDKAEGSAAIENGNTKLAHQQALDAAIRDALVKGAGAQLDSVTMTEGAELVRDTIFVHANGYVKSYSVAEDAQQQDGTWLVRLQDVVVGTGDLSKDAAAVRAELIRRGHPRLYALIREQAVETISGKNPGEKEKAGSATLAQLSQGVVEQGLISHMTPIGWQFVDPQVASGKVHVENAMTTDLGNLNGKDFALTGADYVILGSVIARPVEGGAFGVSTVQLRTVLYVKATDTGETVASVEKSENVASTFSINDASTKAMEKAGAELAEALQKQVLELWRKQRGGVGKVVLTVAVADYDTLQAFEEQLSKGVANVKSVDEVSFNDGRAELSVGLAGTSPKQLAGSLSSKSVKGMQVKVTKVTTNTVEVKLVR